MIKQTLVVLALIGLAFSAPQQRKPFHEHFEDFMSVIVNEVGDDIRSLMDHYLEYEEFSASLEYMWTNNFKDIVYEMESLPEFQAVVEFLENDNIDIHFFIDIFNELIESSRVKRSTKSTRHTVSGTDMSSFISDSIELFPKDKLSALFDDKMANDEEFSTAINNLKSDEWDEVFSALWESETFINEIKALDENGINVHAFLHEIKAIFGQE